MSCIILVAIWLCFTALLVQQMKHQRNPDVLCICINQHEPRSTYVVFVLSYSATVSKVSVPVQSMESQSQTPGRTWPSKRQVTTGQTMQTAGLSSGM